MSLFLSIFDRKRNWWGKQIRCLFFLCLDTLEPEQFTYEIVIPRSFRSSSIVPDWKARLRDENPFDLDSIFRPKRSSKSAFSEHSNNTLYYRIHGFNRTFDLSLYEEETFLSPSFVIQHFDHNRTWLSKDIQHCFYKGYVNQNPSSTVSISLCHGLVSIWREEKKVQNIVRKEFLTKTSRRKEIFQMKVNRETLFFFYLKKNFLSFHTWNDFFFILVRNIYFQWYGVFYRTSISSKSIELEFRTYFLYA